MVKSFMNSLTEIINSSRLNNSYAGFVRLYEEIIREWIISYSGGQTMLYLFHTTPSNVYIAQYDI